VSDAEDLFDFQCRCLKLEPVREHVWHPTRKWRFDFAFTDRQVAVEIEGGVYIQGRHTRGRGIIEDMQKYNEATRLGWQVYRFPVDAVKDGSAIQYMEGILKWHG